MLRKSALCLFMACAHLQGAFAQTTTSPADPASLPAASSSAAAAAKTGAPTETPASNTAGSKGKTPSQMACTATTAQEAVLAIVKIAPSVEQVRTVSRVQVLPDSGSVDVLLFNRFSGKDGKVPDGEKTSFRVVLIDSETANAIAAHPSSEPPKPKFSEVIPSSRVWAEAATGGVNGTDFKKNESSDEKTLLRFSPDLQDTTATWQPTRVYIIGCTGVDASVPKFVGSFETRISSTTLCRVLAILLCAIFYCLAAVATFFIHKSQRVVKGVVTQDSGAKGDHPTTGTNYAGWLRHFDPVVLSAGSNGRGSATKLQVLFFSLLVFGLVSYIWMLTGHLTGLSTTVLLLMGISGLGATASAGTDLTKNQLDFDKWAWLINRGWVPKGGVAEANLAQWKDIVTTNGEFDVYRFQMVTFSVLVGIALLGAGTQLTDLSSFDIPQALLGILGLSQVVYVAGKLVAPPAISDLNTQIEKLQAAEKNLRDKLDTTNPALLAETAVLLTEDDKLKAAKLAYNDYLLAWETTRTMFEATLGRLVPKAAESFRPPFPVPQVISALGVTLKPGKVDESYQVSLLASGGTPPYKWTLVDGVLPAGLSLSADGKLEGIPTQGGETKFTLRAEDSAGAGKSKEFTVSIAAV